MQKKIYQVDAFTNKAFGGNPAGVVLEAEGLRDIDMQRIANEMALSETAFVFKSNESDYDYRVRFFTPKEEVDLCGHATIATFYLMAKLGLIRPENKNIIIKQKTLAGILPVEIKFSKNKIDKVMMNQSKPKKIFTLNNLVEIANIMGIKIEEIGVENYNVVPMIYSTGLPDIILPVNNIDILEKIQPNFSLLSEYSKKHNVVGVHAFTFKNKEKKLIECRNFAPAYGINEEAATGTSNGALAAYLIENNIIYIDKEIDIVCQQGHFMNRPSQIHVKAIKKDDKLTIKVGGEAVIIMEGTIYF